MRRKVSGGRLALLFIFIAGVVMAFLWAIQSVYEIMPAGQTVLAIEGGQVNDYPLQLAAIWQGSKGKPFMLAKQAANLSKQQTEKSKSYIGIGHMMYCIQQSQQAEPGASTEKILEQCEQLRKQLAAQPDGGQPSTEPSENEGEPDHHYAGKVYLTFDDGPSQLTATILDMLAEADIKATFFVLGEKVEKLPKLAERVVEEGHSIGNHTYNHRYDELYRSPQNFVDQVLNANKAIYDATGVVTPLFRAPGGSYGNLDASYMKALTDAGYLVFDWNVDSGDSRSSKVTSEEIIANVKEAKLRERMIVLMHDSATHQATVDALPQIIAYFQSLNYQFVLITSETEPLTSPVADSIKWQRTAMSDQQAQMLKVRTEQLRVQARQVELAELKVQ